jgi:nucleotide-binding universal stress UspA family protein
VSLCRRNSWAIALIRRSPVLIRNVLQLFQDAQREAAHHDIKIKTILSEGPVVASLVEALQKHYIDLLVLGIHPVRGLLGGLIASTTHELALRAACDILGVR